MNTKALFPCRGGSNSILWTSTENQIFILRPPATITFFHEILKKLANFLSFSTFSNGFTLKWLKMTHNGQFCQKSGLDWLQTANFGHFAGFSIFSPKMRLRLTQNGQFHLIHNFSHLLPPKHLIFEEISKIFVPCRGEGGTSARTKMSP